MSEDGNSRLAVVIVSGLSGAGKTVALRALEDTGFFCIDNLPVTLIESFLSTIKSRVNYPKCRHRRGHQGEDLSR